MIQEKLFNKLKRKKMKKRNFKKINKANKYKPSNRKKIEKIIQCLNQDKKQFKRYLKNRKT